MQTLSQADLTRHAGALHETPCVAYGRLRFKGPSGGSVEPGFYGITIRGPIGNGVTGALQASIIGAVKVNGPLAEFNVANEFIAARLALAVGLPCPPGSMVRTSSGEVVYAMMRFGLAGEMLPPVDPGALCADHHFIAAGIVMFDEWILNGDRHTSNIAYESSAGVGIFDHGHALFGVTRSDVLKRLTAWQGQPTFGGCLRDELVHSLDLTAWANRIAQIPHYLIDQTCDSVKSMALITRDERDAMVGLLKYRQSTIHDRWRHPNLYSQESPIGGCTHEYPMGSRSPYRRSRPRRDSEHGCCFDGRRPSARSIPGRKEQPDRPKSRPGTRRRPRLPLVGRILAPPDTAG